MKKVLCRGIEEYQFFKIYLLESVWLIGIDRSRVQGELEALVVIDLGPFGHYEVFLVLELLIVQSHVFIPFYSLFFDKEVPISKMVAKFTWLDIDFSLDLFVDDKAFVELFGLGNKDQRKEQKCQTQKAAKSSKEVKNPSRPDAKRKQSDRFVLEGESMQCTHAGGEKGDRQSKKENLRQDKKIELHELPKADLHYGCDGDQLDKKDEASYPKKWQKKAQKRAKELIA